MPTLIKVAQPPASSYEIDRPDETHWREATCEEVTCGHRLMGWSIDADPSTPLGLKQIDYIRKRSKREFTEERQPTGLIRFTFAPGQRCFREHKVAREISPIFREVRGRSAEDLPFVEFADRMNDHFDKFYNPSLPR